MTLTFGSRIERFKQGKALRRETPREAHSDFKGSLSRSAVTILAESDRDRVPELVPERYARMSIDPFAFLRILSISGRALHVTSPIVVVPCPRANVARNSKVPFPQLWFPRAFGTNTRSRR